MLMIVWVIWSDVWIICAFAWKLRCAVIMLTSCAVMSTFEDSSAPDCTRPKPELPAWPFSGWPEANVCAQLVSPNHSAFQTASGDTHPIHYDVEYCRARGMPHLLAHGFQTLVHTAPGAGLFPFVTEEALVGFLEQSSKFLKPSMPTTPSIRRSR